MTLEDYTANIRGLRYLTNGKITEVHISENVVHANWAPIKEAPVDLASQFNAWLDRVRFPKEGKSRSKAKYLILEVADNGLQKLVPGATYDNVALSRTLGVSTLGGIRYKRSATGDISHVVIVTGENDHPYQDRWLGRKLLYTGEGLEGNQTLSRGNLALYNQMRKRYPIYGFQKLGVNRYRYIGMLDVVSCQTEIQPDVNRAPRQVYVFELVLREPKAPPPQPAAPRKKDEDILANLATIQGSLQSETLLTERYRRSRELVEELKQLYDYRCQLCDPSAPDAPEIPMRDGRRYVEVHHIKGFAEVAELRGDSQEEGEYLVDNYRNTIVVCCYHHKLLTYYTSPIEYVEARKEFVSKDKTVVLPLRNNKHL